MFDSLPRNEFWPSIVLLYPAKSINPGSIKVLSPPLKRENVGQYHDGVLWLDAAGVARVL